MGKKVIDRALDKAIAKKIGRNKNKEIKEQAQLYAQISFFITAVDENAQECVTRHEGFRESNLPEATKDALSNLGANTALAHDAVTGALKSLLPVAPNGAPVVAQTTP